MATQQCPNCKREVSDDAMKYEPITTTAPPEEPFKIVEHLCPHCLFVMGSHREPLG